MTNKTEDALREELKATQGQLDLLGEYFLLALDKLPKKTLTVSLSEQARIGEVPLTLQGKTDKNGATHFRAVPVK